MDRPDRRGAAWRTGRWFAVLGMFSFSACGQGTLTEDELRDPESCAGCHPDHYREWSGSMHAYASRDPVFLAMNALGQRETGGALGDFCIQCHAPLALAEGLTTDGTNMDEVPDAFQGITCFFCHSVAAVDGEHNNPLRLADDGVLRGGIQEPVQVEAHPAAYSTLHDRNHLDSSSLCGACHDIVTPAGVALERTYAEWRETLYANDDPAQRLTCGGCHMDGRDGEAAALPDLPLRRIHSHAWPGVDRALTPFPEAETQAVLVQDALDTTLFSDVCVRYEPEGWTVEVGLENVAAGHRWPSGAAQDRRAWVDLVVRGASGEELLRSGAVGDEQAVVDAAAEDASMWWLGDRMFDAGGQPAHMFWEAAATEAGSLPGPTALDPQDPAYTDTHVWRTWRLGAAEPYRVEARVHVRPLDLDVLDVLVASLDLDPAVAGAVGTDTLAGSEVRWDRADGRTCANTP